RPGSMTSRERRSGIGVWSHGREPAMRCRAGDRRPPEPRGTIAQRPAALRIRTMAIVAGTKPHPIFLAGRWVESPDPLVVANPADPSTPAGSTYHATEAQYEEAVE